MTAEVKFVPPVFVSLVKTCLYRLVAAKLVKKELVGEELWKSIRSKFSNKIQYNKKLAQKVCLPTYLLTSFFSVNSFLPIYLPTYLPT